MRDEILVWYYNSRTINEAFSVFVDNRYIDDLKSHITFELINMPEDKLERLYNTNELELYIRGMIKNQYNSKTSSFFRIYRNDGFSGDRFLEYNIENKEIPLQEQEDFTIENKIRIKEVNDLLDNQYDNLLINQYHRTLYKMKVYEGRTLKEIYTITNINKDTISRSVRRTKEYIRKNIKNK